MASKYKKPNKNRKLDSPSLKNVLRKKNYIIRLKSNYGANSVEDTKFFSSLLCVNLIHNVERENTNILAGANDNVKKRKKKKSLNFIYYILNIAVIVLVLSIQLSKESNPTGSITAILNINLWFILAAFGCFLVGMFLDQIRYSFLIHKATGVFRFGLSYKVAALGRYYDTITPLGTGGQPFQVLYTNKYGIKPGEGISIAMGKYIFYQIVYFILVTYFILRALSVGEAGTTILNTDVSQSLVSTFMWVGYAILAAVVLFMTLISLNKRLGAGFIASILKLLNKIHIGKFRIIKDYKKTFTKVMKVVNVWQNTTKKYSKSFWVIFVNVVGSVLFFFVNYSTPFFIFCAFEGWQPNMWLNIISVAVMVDLTSAFNPIPMGTGTADLSFTVLYGGMFSIAGASIWALIIWRILFYYIYIIQGLIIVNYDYFVGNKRLEKNKELWMLPIREQIKIRKNKAK